VHHIDYRLGLLRASVVEGLPEKAVVDLADVYLDLANERHLAGYEVSQRFYEIGSHHGLEETVRYLAGTVANSGRVFRVKCAIWSVRCWVSHSQSGTAFPPQLRPDGNVEASEIVRAYATSRSSGPSTSMTEPI
jgi:hypothetical protein